MNINAICVKKPNIATSYADFNKLKGEHRQNEYTYLYYLKIIFVSHPSCMCWESHVTLCATVVAL